jgi:hypothetical protein
VRGDKAYARRNEVAETPVQMRTLVTVREARFVKAREALDADGNVRRVGIATALSVYERPCSLGNIRFVMNESRMKPPKRSVWRSLLRGSYSKKAQ